METAKRLDLEEYQKNFMELMETTAAINKLASWAEDSNLKYIHLKKQFTNAIKLYEAQRSQCFLTLIEYKAKYGEDTKLNELLDLLNKAEIEMNRFLAEVYEFSKNELFNYQLEEL